VTLQIKKRDLLSQAQAVSESHRTNLDRQISAANSFLDEALGEALSGFPILESPTGKRDLIDTVMQIHSSWHSMGRAALKTGKLLLRIYRMDKSIYQALFRKEKSILPFGQSVESKLRRIAEAVEQGRVDENRLPSAYSAAYEIVTLDDEKLKLADAKGLLRPETQRDDVLMFKHEVRRSKAVEETPRLLRLQRVRLARRLETLMQEVAEIDAEIARINQRLNAPGMT
jgi:hypothetical protein